MIEYVTDILKQHSYILNTHTLTKREISYPNITGKKVVKTDSYNKS